MNRSWTRLSIQRAGWTLALAALLLVSATDAQSPASEPSLKAVMQRVGEYVAGYGEQAALIVATERYTQQVWSETGAIYKPRQVLAEFAIVRAAGSVGWIGFRDVVEVNGAPVGDRKDRLEKLLRDPSGNTSEAIRISNESARYNIGPISRNFNVPTTTLFFLHPATQWRFSFSRKGTKTIDGVETWAIAFKETRRPTLIMTRGGKDVPCEGTIWVVPADGTIVRTRLQLRGFADSETLQVVTGPAQTGPAPGQAPPLPPQNQPTAPPSQPPPPTQSTGGSSGGQRPGTSAPPVSTGQPPQPAPLPPPAMPAGSLQRQERVKLESLADIEVSFRRDERLGLWLPTKMSELYEGAIPRGGGSQPFLGRATSVATYADFRRFETSVKITVPK